MSADRPTDTNRLLALEQELLRLRNTGGTDQPAQAFEANPAPTQNRLLSLANELLNYQNLAERLRSRTTADPDSPPEETQSMSNDDFSVANQLLDLERSLLKQRGNGSTDNSPNEARAYDFDQPIVFRDPNAIAMGVDGEIVTNQLMELERSLTAHKPDSPNGKSRKKAPETVTAMAFDFDEAIQLEYDSSAFDSNAVEQAYSYDYDVTAQSYYPESYAAALMDDSTSPEAFGLQDEPAAFEVEAFADSGTTQSGTYPIATPPGAAIPVQATVVTASDAIAQSVYSDAYDSSGSADAFAEDSFGFAASDDIADAEAFAADLQAILSGAKTYEPETKQTITTPPSSPSSPPPPTPEPSTTNPTPLSQSHAIFDQVTHNMAYANAFDLGNISMEQRFDEFDRLLDKAERQSPPKPGEPATVNVTPNVQTVSTPLQLDHGELSADFAAMNIPSQPGTQIAQPEMAMSISSGTVAEALTFTTQTQSDGSVEVSEKGKLCLVFKPAKVGPPPSRKTGKIDSADAIYIQKLARNTLMKVRLALPEGTLNNKMKLKPTEPAQYITKKSPKFLNDTVDSMWYSLADLDNEKNPKPDFVKMAAYDLAARKVGGGVCSMIAHVAVGILTTTAENTLVNLVVDKNFDHSYVVIARGDSAWFVIDPWVGTVYVCPWADNFFPRRDVSHYFEVEVKSPVSQPYGVTFTPLELQAAEKARSAQKQGTQNEMDNAYAHPTNLKAEVEAQNKYKPVLLPGDWGANIGHTANPDGPFNIFG